MPPEHLMKSITTTASVRKADSSLDATLNPVELSSKEVVSWAVAFPRHGDVVASGPRPEETLLPT
jgi:hypothetical protein